MVHTAIPIPPAVREILFATDFSEPSRIAAGTAHAYALQLGARLHILYVERPNVPVTIGPTLERLAGEIGAGIHVVTTVALGNPAEEIVRYARQHMIDLIIVGAHGRTGATHVLLGSVAERVARTAPCPVVTVPRIQPLEGRPQEVPLGIRGCLICGTPSDDLFCESCRVRIRALGSPAPTFAHRKSYGELTQEQVDEVLRTEIIGRLACHADDQTYVVPITYVYHHDSIYIHSDEGLKIRMMRENPRVCFQVDQIKDLANWRSVIAWGVFRELHGPEATDGLLRIRMRLTSLTAIEGTRPTPSYDTNKHEGFDHRPIAGGREAVIGCIDLTEKTGRFEQR